MDSPPQGLSTLAAKAKANANVNDEDSSLSSAAGVTHDHGRPADPDNDDGRDDDDDDDLGERFKEEPYDSPERSRRTTTMRLGQQQQRRDDEGAVVDDDDEENLDNRLQQYEGGDLGRRTSVPGRFSMYTTTNKDKGKGKMVDRVDSDDDDDDDDDEDENDRFDEEQEERKIRENLAKWAKADANRRASIRRTSQFVTPTFVAPAAAASAATTLIRRTSTMVRSNKKKPSSAAIEGAGRRGQSDERGDVRGMEMTSSGRPEGNDARRVRSASKTTRKGRRKESVVLDQGRDGVRSPDLDDDVADASRASITSSGSRFIEDLPLPTLATSSPRAFTGSTTERQRNPFSPPVTPTKNPFSDPDVYLDSSRTRELVDLDATPKGRQGPSNRLPRARPPSSPSQQSLQSVNSLESQPSSTATIISRGGEAALAAAIDDRLTEQDDREARRSQPLFRDGNEPRPSLPFGTNPTRQFDDDGDEGLHDDEGDDEATEERNDSVRGKVGFLDWILCGCWRPRGWDRQDAVETGGARRRDWDFDQQQGRTNPME